MNKLKHILLFLGTMLLLTMLSGCEGKVTFESLVDEVETQGGSATSNLSFSGIDSISNVTDSTATINWTHVAGATSYRVFSVSAGVLTYITTVDAPATSYELVGLASNSALTFGVRLIDSESLADDNTNYETITTNTAPDAPAGVSLLSPTGSPALDDTPAFTVSGVKDGDTVKIFSNNDCSTEIGSATATGSSVSVTASSLADGTHTIYANATNSNASSSSCSVASVSYTLISCPHEYIAVPGNAVVGATDDFCVMKYEAKDIGGVATSAATANPWISINQTTAYTACNDLNTEGTTADKENDTNSDGTYAMISNPEWMAIARNVETNTENEELNWSGGSVGIGILARGWVTSNTAVAPFTGANCLYNSAANTCAATGDLEDKRVLTLSNGEEIWDLSGNVWEWVDWTLGAPLSTNMSQANKPYDGDDAAPVAAYREFTQIDTFSVHAPATSILPTGSALNGASGVGRYYGHTSGGAARRGGYWYTGTSAGAFALNLLTSSGSASTYLGFRCVFRLP